MKTLDVVEVGYLKGRFKRDREEIGGASVYVQKFVDEIDLYDVEDAVNRVLDEVNGNWYTDDMGMKRKVFFHKLKEPGTWVIASVILDSDEARFVYDVIADKSKI